MNDDFVLISLMKRPLRFVVVLAAALGFVPFLPLYIQRTMLRSLRVNHAGDVVNWGWQVISLTDYWSKYQYFSSKQQPALWLAVNLGLALAYALVIAIVVDRLFARRKRRRSVLTND
jgi:hypothetical protein